MELVNQVSLSNALLEAVKRVSDASVSESKQTIVIEAKIIDVVDQARGIYKVRYNGGYFNVFASNTSFIYDKDEMVYVMVPEGDFEKNMIILSPVSADTMTMSAGESGVLYIPYGEDLFFQTNFPQSAPFELCTYGDSAGEDYELAIPTIAGYEETFTACFNTALTYTHTFDLTCKIKTDIAENRRIRGNYGLILSIPVLQDAIATEYKVTLDINNMKGSVYNFQEYALQHCYFTLPNNVEYNPKGVLKLIGFVKNFMKDNPPSPLKSDIFFADIQFLPIKVVNELDQSGYFLNISATQGTNFFGAASFDSSKILTPNLYLNGKPTTLSVSTSSEVSERYKWECYWFKENGFVGNTHDKWNRYGGIGWEILNEVTDSSVAEDGRTLYVYKTDNYSYKVKQLEVHTELRYKCVLVRGDDIVSDIITIRNLASSAKIDLTTSTGSNVYLDGVGDVNLILTYFEEQITNTSPGVSEYPKYQINYAWVRYDRMGNNLGNDFYTTVGQPSIYDPETGSVSTQIKFNTNIIDKLNTIACTISVIKTEYDTTENIEITSEYVVGTKSITISTTEEIVMNIELENANILYKYDSDGDSPMVANYDGPVSSKINNILPITIKRITKADGTEFSEDEYLASEVEWRIPRKSTMILIDDSSYVDIDNPDYYIYRGSFTDYNKMAYKISSTYNKTAKNNVISLKVTLKDMEVSTLIPMNFIKEGESGTNGTKYTASIVYGKNTKYGYEEMDSDGKIHKCQLVYMKDYETDAYGNGAWFIFNPAWKSDIDSGLRHIGTAIVDPVTGDTIYPAATGDDFVFEVEMYCDGEKIVFNENYILDAEWTIFDDELNLEYNNILSPLNITTGVDDKRGTFSIREVYPDTDPAVQVNYPNLWNQNYNICTTIQVKCQASRQDMASSTTNSEEYIYAYYPIEVTYIEQEALIKNFLPSIVGGYSQVVYASDGTNPQYDNSNAFNFMDSGLDDVIDRIKELYPEDVSADANISEYTWTFSPNLTFRNDRTSTTSSAYIVPTTKFDNGESRNYIKVSIGFDDNFEEFAEDALTNATADNLLDNGIKNVYDNLTNNAKLFKDFSIKDSSILTSDPYGRAVALLNSSNIILNLKNDLLTTLESMRKTAMNTLNAFNQVPPSGSAAYGVYQSLRSAMQLAFEEYAEVNSLGNLSGSAPLVDFYNHLLTLYPPNLYLIQTIPNTGVYTGDYNSVNRYIENFNNLINGQYTTIFNNFVQGGSSSVVPPAIVQINSLINDVRDILAVYLNDARWTIYTNFDPLGDAELINIKSMYNTLYNTLVNKVNQLDKLGKNYNLITKEVLNPMKDILNGYLNVDYSEKKKDYEARSRESEGQVQYYDQLINLMNSTRVIHIKPIIMIYNRYEMGFINGWDGNKLVIDENGGYVVAPQMGAGYKEIDNSFTGMLMGVFKRNGVGGSGRSETGLIGQKAGTRTLFLNANDGSAVFGKSGGGQIYIDPESGGKIFSGNYYTRYDTLTGKPDYTTQSGNGMLIDLQNGCIHLGNADTTVGTRKGFIYSGEHANFTDTTPGFNLSAYGLSIGNGVRIQHNGDFIFGDSSHLTRAIVYNSANKTINFGTEIRIVANEMDCSKLTGTTISGKTLVGGGGIYVPNTTAPTFKVESSGKMTATNADISGKITCNSGSIGGWRIDSSGLYSSNEDLRLKPNGYIAFRDSASNRVYFTGDKRRSAPSNTIAVCSADDGSAGNMGDGALYLKTIYMDGYKLKINKDGVYTRRSTSASWVKQVSF